ncbi:MAG: hypothetical protein ACERLM_02050 [Acidimicrobiales bacterium]
MTATTQKIDKAQIEAKFQELKAEVDTTTDEAKGYAVSAGAVIALVLVIAFFLLGRSRGKRSRAVVEIIRI